MLKILVGLTVLAASAFATQAGAQPASAPTLVAAGKLTYGTAATFAPFEFQKDGAFTGFDIEFGAAVAAKMGLAPVITNMEFGGLIPALQGHRIDVINSGMYINPKRSEAVDFVPYMKIGNQIVVRQGNPLGIRSRDDLCGHRVAVTLGGIEETYAREDVAKCQKAGKPEVVVLTLPTMQDSALSVRQGRADALFDATPGAIKLTTELPDVYQIAGDSFENDTQIGIAVRKGDATMHDAVEKAMRAVAAEGTYAKLLTKYGLPPSGSMF
ncbi:MAG: ABC transporter substrate-binding protein [Janthinobacterium lividum]